LSDVKILAISGSLSRSSSNAALLRAASRIGRQQIAIEVYERMAGLPLFNVDLDIDPAPASVVDFRARLVSSDGILISPEYAHGISGVLKNALDRTVSSGEFYEKPVAVFNASPRATLAQASLTEILKTIGSTIVEVACITVPLLGKHLDPEGIVADAAIANSLRTAVRALTQAISAMKV
jgi:chromate reductase, NAD(P)H dehydrogenase (quinone)